MWDRREALRIGAMSVLVGGQWLALTPREAFAAGASPVTLTELESSTLEAVGEALVPGARVAGIAQYVDSQLSAPLADCLLAARLLGLAPPYVDFYKAALRAINECCARQWGSNLFADLLPARQGDFLRAMHSGTLTDWRGPPAAFSYFLFRNDAVDVRYGTEDGFAELGVPYMPHIAPVRRW